MMIDIQNIDGNPDLLAHSRLLFAMQRTFQHIGEHDGIGLTKSKAFNRKFTHWAAEHYDWPEYELSKLLRINKVLNEEDVPPVMVIHDLMVLAKLGRPYKGTFRMTVKAKALTNNPGKLFAELAQIFLFQYDHGQMSRFGDVAPGNWDVFLNVINVEAESGVAESDLVKTFYGVEDTVGTFDREYHWYKSSLFITVLRPLCWIGFLEETREGDDLLAPRLYTKTPLWRACLHLDTDDMLQAIKLI